MLIFFKRKEKSKEKGARGRLRELFVLRVGGSSNGRTTAFGAVNLSSILSPPALGRKNGVSLLANTNFWMIFNGFCVLKKQTKLNKWWVNSGYYGAKARKNRYQDYLVYAVFLLGIFGLVFYFVFMMRNYPAGQEKSKLKPAISMQDNLGIDDIVIGKGQQAQIGDEVLVHYKGTLLDGTSFDSSYDRGAPFSFTLGQRQVIPGWEQGILGMRVGGKRKLIIPPSLAYGDQEIPGLIPANSTLVFEIELIQIR